MQFQTSNTSNFVFFSPWILHNQKKLQNHKPIIICSVYIPNLLHFPLFKILHPHHLAAALHYQCPLHRAFRPNSSFCAPSCRDDSYAADPYHDLCHNDPYAFSNYFHRRNNPVGGHHYGMNSARCSDARPRAAPDRSGRGSHSYSSKSALVSPSWTATSCSCSAR